MSNSNGNVITGVSNSTSGKCADCGRWTSPSTGACTYCTNRSQRPKVVPINLRPVGPINNAPSGSATTGLGFSSSPRFRTEESLQQEYRERLARVQAPQVTPIGLPLPKRGHHIGIVHVGDVHIGTDACAFDAFSDLLEWVDSKDDEYLTLQGDLVDFLTGSSVGIMAEQSMVPRDQMNLAMRLLRPLAKKGKILWMLRGNHEERLDKATKNIFEPCEQMANQLDVRYLETEGYTLVQSGGMQYSSYNIHGFNAGRKAGARRNKMEEMLLKMQSDVVTCGHNHHLDAIQMVTQSLDPTTLKPTVRYQWGVYTGTYHTYLGYAADAGYTAGPLGCVRMEFDVKHGILVPRILPVVQQGDKYIQTLPA